MKVNALYLRVDVVIPEQYLLQFWQLWKNNVLVVFNLRFLIGHILHIIFVWIFLLTGILGKWKMFLQYGQV